MTPDHPSLESELQGLRPSPVDDALLDRLEACTDGSLTVLTPTELQFEASLRKFSPQSLPADLMADLEGVFAGVPFAKDEKVVLFPKHSKDREKISRFPRPMWAAAAAVALIGAASALLIPAGKQPSAPVAKASTPAPFSPITRENNIVPASYGNAPSEAHEEGVIWNDNNQPHRVMKMTYHDVVKTRNAQGKVVEVVRPRYEYILIPEKVD